MASSAGTVSSVSIPASSRFEHACSVLQVIQDDTTILLHLESGRYYSLNRTGGQVWQLLGEHRPQDEIVACLVAEYDVPLTQATADTERITSLLRHSRLIREVVQ